ncbi:PASTA domain-containing protein [Microbacterium sp. NIBRBAC000506063]|nr:PASTA domain-containing protein [Microbacterium sp. NIBRBAC000506063]QTV80377.1 PASTA domain-containing protein [Microbacterium sp. NIBRBAC000506063]
MLGGTVWALVNGGAGEPDPTTTSETPSVTPSSPEPTPTETRIDVDALGLIGLDCTEARSIAQNRGLSAECVDGNAAENEQQEGTVYRVNPEGSVPEGTSLTLTVYGGVVPIGAPQNAPTLSATPETDATVTLSWSAFQCPSGTGPSPATRSSSRTRSSTTTGRIASSPTRPARPTSPSPAAPASR